MMFLHMKSNDDYNSTGFDYIKEVNWSRFTYADYHI